MSVPGRSLQGNNKTILSGWKRAQLRTSVCLTCHLPNRLNFISHSARGRPRNYGSWSATDQLGLRKGKRIPPIGCGAAERKEFLNENPIRSGFFPSSSQRCEKLDPSFSDELNAWGGGSKKDLTSPKSSFIVLFYKRNTMQLNYQLCTIKFNSTKGDFIRRCLWPNRLRLPPSLEQDNSHPLHHRSLIGNLC